MPTYKYQCTNCGKNYLEHRDASEQQTFTKCDACGAEYTEVTE